MVTLKTVAGPQRVEYPGIYCHGEDGRRTKVRQPALYGTTRMVGSLDHRQILLVCRRHAFAFNIALSCGLDFGALF